MEQIGLALSLYSWIALAFIVVLVYHIARFYQQKSGERSHYRWFLVPAGLFTASGVVCVLPGGCRDVLFNVSNALLLVGGVVLIALSRSLFVIMTGGRK